MLFFNIMILFYVLVYTFFIIFMQCMGFSVGEVQCFVVFLYVFVGIVMIFIGWFGDKYYVCGFIIIFNQIFCLIGLFIMGWVEVFGVCYFGVFFVIVGVNVNIFVVMFFQVNNVCG